MLRKTLFDKEKIIRLIRNVWISKQSRVLSGLFLGWMFLVEHQFIGILSWFLFAWSLYIILDAATMTRLTIALTKNAPQQRTWLKQWIPLTEGYALRHNIATGRAVTIGTLVLHPLFISDWSIPWGALIYEYSSICWAFTQLQRPPYLIYLGASGSDSRKTLIDIQNAIAPFRVLSLIHPGDNYGVVSKSNFFATVLGSMRVEAQARLREEAHSEWPTIVEQAMRFTRFVVLDIRVPTSAVRDEMRFALSDPSIRAKIRVIIENRYRSNAVTAQSTSMALVLKKHKVQLRYVKSVVKYLRLSAARDWKKAMRVNPGTGALIRTLIRFWGA